MEILLYFGGVFTGAIITWFVTLNKFNKKQIHGVIEIDHSDNTCRFLTNLDELVKSENKEVIFTINHNAHFSRK